MEPTREFRYFADKQNWIVSLLLDVIYFVVIIFIGNKELWKDLWDDIKHLAKLERRVIITFSVGVEIVFPIQNLPELPDFVFEDGKILNNKNVVFGEYKVRDNTVVGWYKN